MSRPARPLPEWAAKEYKAGATLETISGRLGWSLSAVWLRLRAIGVTMRRRGGPEGSRLVVRDAEICAARSRGESHAQIGRAYGVSRQRIHQITSRAK